MDIDSDVAPPRLLDLKEASKRLGLQRSAIYELFASGQLTKVNITPRKTVVLEAELSQLILRRFNEARQRKAA